jgi:hypothetical protein
MDTNTLIKAFEDDTKVVNTHYLPRKRKAADLDNTITNILRNYVTYIKKHTTFMAHMEQWTKTVDTEPYTKVLNDICKIQEALNYINTIHKQENTVIISALPVYFIRDITRNCNTIKVGTVLRELILTNQSFLAYYCNVALLHEATYGIDLPGDDYSVPHYSRDVMIAFEYSRLINNLKPEYADLQLNIERTLAVLPHFRIICDISDNTITRDILTKYQIADNIIEIMT